MTDLIQLLMDYASCHQLPRYLDQCAYDEAKRLEEKHLSALKEGLSGDRVASLERYQQAREDSRSLELQAMFLAAFSMARELC